METVTALPPHVSPAMEGSTSVATVDNTSATELQAPVSLPTSSGATDLPQSMFDLSAIATAIDFAAGGAAQPSDATPQVTRSKKRSKQRRRAKRNASDFFYAVLC